MNVLNDYTKPLNNSQWSEHYNLKALNNVINSIQNNNVQVWAEELVNIIEEGKSCLEIGCGSGISSLWLAKNNRKASALDFTQSSVDLVKKAASELSLNVDVVLADATRELPFSEKRFDYIFQSGLLEHFTTERQIELLKNWKKYSKKMISMIPNKSSLPYRVGKQIMEENGTWSYGLEIPKYSLIREFESAGITVIDEYTIGTEWALRFLPKDHYIRGFFEKLMNEKYNLDDIMQGYLLVTIGNC